MRAVPSLRIFGTEETGNRGASPSKALDDIPGRAVQARQRDLFGQRVAEETLVGRISGGLPSQHG